MGVDEQIKAVEDEIFKTQKNKATEHHIGKLKAKIAHLREAQEKRRSSGGGGRGFAVKKSGHATVGLIGLPSVGKSTLLNAVTGTESKVAAYAFTTLDVIPGLLEFRGAKIQILDMPGIIAGAAKGRGRGREVLSVARNADLLMLLVDATQPATLSVVVRELADANIRVNQKPPEIIVSAHERGGLGVQFTVPPTHVDAAYIKDIASEFKVMNADVVVRQDVTIDEVVDAFAGNRTYQRGILVFSKSDQISASARNELVRKHRKEGWPVVAVSAERGDGIGELKDVLYQTLRFIRIYLRPQGGEADYKEPLVMKEGASIGVICDTLHRDMRRKFRYAQVWGSSAKFPGQTVGADHLLRDEDVVTLVVRRG